jgi:hypothetical protein
LFSCIDLVVQKAKYGEHFSQVAYLCEVKKIPHLSAILVCAAKAIEHPAQSGRVLRALFFNGFEKEGLSYWQERISAWTGTPSYLAQILACGLWFDSTKGEAKERIDAFLKSSADAESFAELTIEPKAPKYNFL